MHIVSSRVDKTTGKKISSAFENIRSQTAMNKIMKLDPVRKAKADFEKALGFNFQTKAQFMMILESQGYKLTEKNNKFQLIRFGQQLFEADQDFLKERSSNYQINQTRAKQITALLHKFRMQYNARPIPEIVPLPGGLHQQKASYTSELAEFLKQNFGIQLIFHGNTGKQPYGYTVLDHAKGNVFKGGELMDIKMLTADLSIKSIDARSAGAALFENESLEPRQLVEKKPAQCLADPNFPKETFVPYESPIEINISDDIDDEAIHGRNRRRSKQARTNTR
ncbi:hypothetical protein D3C87_1423880 [compost metagenome]